VRALVLAAFLLPAALSLGALSARAGTGTAADDEAGAASGPVRVGFGERGELVVDGVRRFVRAGYRSGQTDSFIDALPTARQAGFDIVHDYHFETYELAQGGLQGYVQDARRYLRRAQQLGLGVYLGLPRELVRNGDEKALAKIVEALAKERALWLWYLYDEPRPDVLDVATAARVYALLHRLDPNHPVVILSNRDETMRQYHASCDVLWLDRYPVAATVKAPSLKPIAGALDAARVTAGARKPLWPVLQAQDNRGSPALRKKVKNLSPPTDATYRPSEAEIRAQAHIAIARGAMATVFYWAPDSWYSMKTDTPRAWASLSRVVQELGSLEPVLLDAPAAQAVAMTGDTGGVLAWTRAHEGRTYLGVVNSDTHKGARFQVRSPAAGGDLTRVLGDGKVTAGASGLDVELGPAGVAVVSFGGP
jgi:hypothetical protein